MALSQRIIRALTLCAVVSAFLCISPSAANAYKATKTPGGKDVKIPSCSMTFDINAASAPAGYLDALQAAMQTWTDVASSGFVFSYGGTTTNSNWAAYDGQNILMFGTDASLPAGTLACNGFFYNDTTGELMESDIIFNKVYAWNATGGSVSPNIYDVQDIGTHEMGHSLSLMDLYDAADSEKTMCGYGAPGETKKRTLDPDDIDGITYLYPDIPKTPTSIGIAIVLQDGLNVTLTATLVNSDTLAPLSGRTVKLYDGSTLKVTSITGADGTYTKTLSGTVGAHTFTARFEGDSAYSGATPASVDSLLAKAPTAMTIAVPSQEGLNVTLTATLINDDTKAALPGKTVYIYDGLTPRANGITDKDGKLTKTLINNALGAHSFNARFSGDTAYDPAVPAVADVTIIKVVLSSPANASTVTTLTPALVWQADPDASKYHVQVATAYTFAAANLVYDSVTADTTPSFTLPASLTYGKTYYWRVQSVLPGGHSPYSDYSRFVCKAWTGLSIISVSQDALKVTFLVKLTKDVGNMSGRTVSFYDGAVLKGSGITLADGTLTKNITSAIGSHTFTAKYAGEATFAPAQSAPSAVSVAKTLLTFPTNASLVYEPTPDLNWASTGDAVGYHVQLGTSSTFGATTMIYNSDTGGTATSLTTPALTLGKVYYCRVWAVLPNGKSVCSDIWRFTYKLQTAIAIGSVTQDALNVTLKARLTGGLDNHSIKGKTVSIYDGATLKGSAVTDPTGSITKTFATGLGLRIFTVKFAGDALDAPAVPVPTGIVTIAKPALTSPLNGAIVATATPTLQWAYSGDALYYHFQVATSYTFGATTLVYDLDTSDNTMSTAAPALTAGKAYYWRVRAVMSTGKSVYSGYYKVTYRP